MDQLLVDLIGKPKLNPSGRIITLIAENFSLLEDNAKFLKATFAIPTEKQLPLDGVNKLLLQLGPIHNDISRQLDKANWNIVQIDQQLTSANGMSFDDKLSNHLPKSKSRSLVYINDASRIQISLGDSNSWLKFLRLLYRWRTQDKHLIVLFYQLSQPTCSTTSLRELEYISDGCVRIKSFKNCYLQSMWFRPIQLIKTLMPVKVETRYYTCKIGKSFWSADLLCFYERKQVNKGHDPDLLEPSEIANVAHDRSNGSKEIDREAVENALNKVGLDEDDDENKPDESTLPYIRAQNPEQSRIFYYPDKDDDVDEDDPDYDLNI